MRKINDPYSPAELETINRYRLERFARHYQEDASKIIEDKPESITMRMPGFAIPLVKTETNKKHEVGRVFMTDELGKTGFRRLRFEYPEDK